jgi:hypothetical protein
MNCIEIVNRAMLREAQKEAILVYCARTRQEKENHLKKMEGLLNRVRSRRNMITRDVERMTMELRTIEERKGPVVECATANPY